MSQSGAALVPRVRELMRLRMRASVADALKSAPEDLQALGTRASTHEEHRLLLSAVDSIAANAGAALLAHFEQHLQDIFDEKLGWLREAETRHAQGFGELNLLDHEELAQQMVLRKLVQKTMDELDAGALVAAEVRICDVFGVKKVEGARNPIGPGTVLKSARRALESLIEEEPVRFTLVNVFQPHLAAGLNEFYADLNAMLIEANIRPDYRALIERGAEGPQPVRKSAAGVTISQAMSLRDLLPGSGSTPIDLKAILSLLLQGANANLKYGARMLTDNEGTLYAHAVDTQVSKDLLEALSKMQAAASLPEGGADLVQDLKSFVQHMQKTEEHPLDQLTGELVAVVFDFLLHEDGLAESIKAEIARLQIVALKAALLDRSFFARRDHPLRLLLDEITRKGSDPALDTRPESRLVVGLRAIVDDLLAQFETNLAIFEQARERLNALAAPVDDARQEALIGLTDRLLVEEREGQAQAQAEDAVKAALRADTPPFLRQFLEQHWRRYLAQVRLQSVDNVDWDEALKTMEQVLQSVYFQSRQERSAFAATLPPLIRRLQQGMRALRLSEEDNREFLDALMHAHTAVLQTARSAELNAGQRPTAPMPMPEPKADPSSYLAHEYRPIRRALLPRGALVEFLDVTPPVRARLSWVSPAQTRYAFVVASGSPRSFSADDLSGALARGTVRLLNEDESPLSRALAAVVSDEEE